MKDFVLQKLAQSHGDRLIALSTFGSRLYGTILPTSDWDFKGVMLPTADQILMQERESTASLKSKSGKVEGVKNGAEDYDVEIFSVYRFLELLAEGQSNAVDLLFTPRDQFFRRGHLFEQIWENRSLFLNKHCKQAVGYAYAQANKYGLRGNRMAALIYVTDALQHGHLNHPRMALGEYLDAYCPNFWKYLETDKEIGHFIRKSIEEGSQLPGGKLEHLQVCKKMAGYTSSVKNAYSLYKKELDEYGDRSKAAYVAGGVDTKALYHALRIVKQTEELLLTGHVTFPRPEADYLIKVRTGEVLGAEVAEKIEEGFDAIRAAQKVSVLRENADWKAINEIVRDTNLAIVRKAYPPRTLWQRFKGWFK